MRSCCKGSSATDCVTDVTDVKDTKKREEGRGFNCYLELRYVL